MWFDLEPVSLAFVETAPFLFENVVLIDAPPARVFQIITNGEGQKEWFQDFVENRWKSAVHGVGAEREVEMRMVTVKERFLAWNPGERVAFQIYAITLPLVAAMLEDMRLEPVGVDKTRLTWRAHYRPTLLTRIIHPIVRAIFGEMFRSSAEGLARYAKAHPA